MGLTIPGNEGGVMGTAVRADASSDADYHQPWLRRRCRGLAFWFAGPAV